VKLAGVNMLPFITIYLLAFLGLIALMVIIAEWLEKRL